MAVQNTSYNIGELIDRGGIVTCFQPVISIKKKKIVGFEALSRGFTAGSDALYPPLELFSAAGSENRIPDLERLCLSQTFDSFKKYFHTKGEFILSININPHLINTGFDPGELFTSATESGLRPDRVLVEFIESRISDTDILKNFISRCRKNGFLIGFDDIETGMSNLDRIALLKPDILKIDPILTARVSQQPHAKEIVRSIVNLSHKQGTLVVAEGIESMEEALSCMDAGVDMLQGYFYAPPSINPEEHIEDAVIRINTTAEEMKTGKVKKTNEKKGLSKKYNQIINDFICELTKVNAESFDLVLESLIRLFPDIECAYILDDRGIQVSNTVFYPAASSERHTFFFQPGEKGTDQSLKDYFFLLASGLAKFTSEPYISLASRNICITISVAFRDSDYQKRILCFDILQHDVSEFRNSV
jgi:EAL domain-containing protein (putative c-di-GMP-specific phosphodiesterase class I)